MVTISRQHLSDADRAFQIRQAFLSAKRHNPNFDTTKANHLINHGIRFSLCPSLFDSNLLKCSIMLYILCTHNQANFDILDCHQICTRKAEATQNATLSTVKVVVNKNNML